MDRKEIVMDVEEIGCEYGNGIQVGHDTTRWLEIVNTIMNLLVPKKTGNSFIKNKQNKRRSLSPQANYIDRATTACRRS
jgi:hypothetical protein